MRCRPFPGTDIKASEAGFGTCTLSTGWWARRPMTKREDLSAPQMERVAVLAEHNFGVDEEPMSYKGTMEGVST